MRRAARRDENEAAIVAALEAAGATVTRLNEPGVPDLLVGYLGETYLLEVIGEAKWKKYRADPRGLTPEQVRWWHGWRGGETRRVRTEWDALEAIGVA